MITRQRTTRTQLFKKPAAVAQMATPEIVELLDSIEHLRTVLYRFTPLLDSKSVDIAIRSQFALKTISDEINHLFTSRPKESSLERLENWDNEGGRLEYDAV